MPSRSRLETPLAWFSIAAATIHFAGETAYQVRLGQYLPMLIVDYVAVALTLWAAATSLRARPGSAAGLLAGAWGFTACLNYMTFFGRLRLHTESLATINGEPDTILPVLGGLLAISGLAFATSWMLARPRRREGTGSI